MGLFSPRRGQISTLSGILFGELEEVVGANGFEPSTSWSRTRRASQAALRPDRLPLGRRKCVSSAIKRIAQLGRHIHRFVGTRFLLHERDFGASGRRISRASVIDGIARIFSATASFTTPSRRTIATASAPRTGERRPRAKVAIFTPRFPRA